MISKLAVFEFVLHLIFDVVCEEARGEDIRSNLFKVILRYRLFFEESEFDVLKVSKVIFCENSCFLFHRTH